MFDEDEDIEDYDYEDEYDDYEEGDDEGDVEAVEVVDDETALAIATAQMKEEIFPTTSVMSEDLLGEHILTGCDYESEQVDDGYNRGRYEDANVIRFTLDGVTYKAVEDPDDGYRSSCGNFYRSYEALTNTFAPHKVIGRLQASADGDIIEFVDAVTGKVVIEVGTDHSDDYYPCCVMIFDPTGLAINIGK